MPDTKKPAKRTATNDASGTFTEDELAAIKERNKELKAAARAKGKDADGRADLLAKIAEMPPADRALAERIDAVVTAAAPELSPKTWYGMPAYARDGKIICFFQPASKFKARYSTFGFNEDAKLDDGTMWATSWALTKLTAADEAKIAALVKKSVS